jgi:hypothetical protein
MGWRVAVGLGVGVAIVLASVGVAAWSEAPGMMTVAELRALLTQIEGKHGEQAGRAVAVMLATGASAEAYLWSECLRGQTVRELREWLRDAAPAELTLVQALRMNDRAHGSRRTSMPSSRSGWGGRADRPRFDRNAGR